MKKLSTRLKDLEGSNEALNRELQTLNLKINSMPDLGHLTQKIDHLITEQQKLAQSLSRIESSVENRPDYSFPEILKKRTTFRDLVKEQTGIINGDLFHLKNEISRIQANFKNFQLRQMECSFVTSFNTTFKEIKLEQSEWKSTVENILVEINCT